MRRSLVLVTAGAVVLGLLAGVAAAVLQGERPWRAFAVLEVLDPELEQRIFRDYGGSRPTADEIEAGLLSDLGPVSEQAADALGGTDPVELQAQIRAVGIPDLSRIWIIATGPDPEGAAARANAFAPAYADRKEQIEVADRRLGLELLAEEIEAQRGPGGDREALAFAKRRRAYLNERLEDGATEVAQRAAVSTTRQISPDDLAPAMIGLIVALAAGAVGVLALLIPLRAAPARLLGFLRIEVRRPADADVLVLAALLIALGTFGTKFADLGLERPPIRPVEVGLVLVAGLALLRLGPARAWRIARERLPLLWLGLFWVVGLIATARGLTALGAGEVEHDVGTLLYSGVVPLAVLVADTPARRRVLVLALAAAGLGGALFFLVGNVGARTFDYQTPLLPGGRGLGVYGLYMSLALAYFATLACFSRRRRAAAVAIAAPLLLMIILTDKRGMWLAAAVALTVAVLLAPPPVRLRAALVAGGAVVALGVVALGFEQLAGPVPPRPPGPERGASAVAPTLLAAAGPVSLPLAQGDEDGSQIGREIVGIGGDSGEAENVRWRLAYWRELLSRVPEAPLLGVGFGEPTRFDFDGLGYDYRTEDRDSSQPYTGPHNGFIEVTYRLGLLGLAGLLGVIVVALLRARDALVAAARRSYERFELTATLAMLAATTVVISFNDAISAAEFSIFFYLLIGLLLARRPLRPTWP